MNRIEYHPYRRYTWFAILQCFLAICGFIGVGLAYPHLGKVLVFLVLFSGYLFGSAMYFFSQSLVTVFIDRNGVLLLQGRNRCNRYVSWVEAPYGYLCRNFKGHRFLCCRKSNSTLSRHSTILVIGKEGIRIRSS